MKWLKNRPSLLICENNLQTIIHYTEVGDRAIIKFPQGHVNGRIIKVLPTGLKVRIWNGKTGTIQFFQWYKIVEIRKLKTKHKMNFIQIKNSFIIVGLIIILVIGTAILYTNIERDASQNKIYNQLQNN